MMPTQNTNDSSPRSTVETIRPVNTVVDDQPRRKRRGGQVVASRIIGLLAGILLILLAFRFVLAIMGAAPSNAFAHFVFTVSYPFVAPFFGLFGYHLVYGASHVEVFTLVAMAVYAVIAWGLNKIINITGAQP